MGAGNLTYDADLYALPIAGNTSLRINRVDLRSLGVELEAYPKALLMPPTRDRLVRLDGKSGAQDFGSQYDVWPFQLQCRIQGLNHTDMIAKMKLFMRWIDMQQNFISETFVKQNAPRSLLFEMAGHKHWYEKGSILAVNGDRLITGGLTQVATGTTTSTSAGNLVDSGGDFVDDGAEVGDTAWNTTDNTSTVVTTVTSGTALALRDDIMASGEVYQIRKNPHWNAYIKPGVQFEIQGDATKYTVQHVHEDGGSLILEQNVVRATLVGATYKSERRLYLKVNYSGTSNVTSLTPRGHFQEKGAGAILRFGLGFRATEPYWIGDINEITFASVVSGTFIELDGVGTAPTPPKIVFADATNAPEVSTAKYGLTVNYDGATPVARHVQNDEDISPTFVGITESYQPSRNGFALQNTTAGGSWYSGTPLRGRKFGFLIRLGQIGFANDVGSARYFFNAYDQSTKNEEVLFFYDGTNQFTLRLQEGGTNADFDVTFAEEWYAADYMRLGGWVDTDGREDLKDGITYYAKLFLNGYPIGTKTTAFTNGTSRIVPSGMDRCFLGGQATSSSSPPTSSDEIESQIEDFNWFNMPPSDEDFQKFLVSDVPLLNTNQTWGSAAVPAANDILTLDAERNTVTFYDDSVISFTSGEADVSGKPIVFTGDEEEKQTLYFEAAATITEVKLIWRPRLR